MKMRRFSTVIIMTLYQKTQEESRALRIARLQSNGLIILLVMWFGMLVGSTTRSRIMLRVLVPTVLKYILLQRGRLRLVVLKTPIQEPIIRIFSIPLKTKKENGRFLCLLTVLLTRLLTKGRPLSPLTEIRCFLPLAKISKVNLWGAEFFSVNSKRVNGEIPKK